ncbi:unnamed protein product, partial [Laminaria digitata]
SGNTGFHFAAYCGRVQALEYLLSQGGDALKSNRRGQTPAMLAALTGRTEVLKWLLENTKNVADVLETTKNRRDLLDFVEDLDEEAVYRCPMYRLLEDA